MRVFRLRGIRRNVLPKFIELGFETPAMLASLWGTQIWRPETNRNIAIKRVLISRELISIKLNTYSKNKDCSGSKIKNKKICRSLTYRNVTAFAYVLLPYYCRVTQYIRIFKRVHKMKNPFELKLCRNTRVQNVLIVHKIETQKDK